MHYRTLSGKDELLSQLGFVAMRLPVFQDSSQKLM